MRYYRKNEYVEPKNFTYKVEEFSGIDALREEERLPLNYAASGYNIRIAGGILKEGYGVGYAKLGTRYLPGAISTGEGIKRLFLYKRFNRSTGARDDRLIFYSDNGKLYQTSLSTGTSFAPINVQLGSDDLTFLNCEYNNKDVLWISDDRGHLVLYDGSSVETVQDTPCFSDACVYNGRVFATSGTGNNVLYFSAKNNPVEWAEANGAGKVTFPDEGGKIVRAVVFKDALIVFREYGIYKYVGYPNSAAYTLTKIFSTEKPIFSKSVCVCGEKIIFVTGNGFYKYEGGNIKGIFKNIFPLIKDLSDGSGCFYEGSYFLSFSMDRESQTVGEEANVRKNNAFLAISPDGRDISLTRGTDVAEFIPVECGGEKALLCRFSYGYRVFDIGMVTETGKVFSTQLSKVWRSPKTVLAEYGTQKYLRKIYLRSKGALTMLVRAEQDLEFSLPQSGKTHCIYVGRNADAVGLTLTSTADKFTVYGLEMEFSARRKNVYDD